MTLAARGLFCGYRPGVWAVRDVDLEVRAGELLGIIGPNGSGKSTLLRALAGLLRPQAGSVELTGRSIALYPRQELARHVAFLPQSVQPAFAFTCEEVVAQGRYAHQGAFGFLTTHDVEVVRRCMVQADVTQFARRPLNELSGGERQRVFLASVLAQEARHLLLDEPTAALDIHHQARIFQLMRDFARDGLSVAVVVHDLNVAAQFCHRLVLLSVGSVAAEGSPREVLTQANLAPVYGGNLVVGENTLSNTPLVTVLTE